MKIIQEYKKKIDFYLINYETILNCGIGDEKNLRTSFKARKYVRQKFVTVTITDKDYKWSEIIKTALESIKYDKISKLAELSFVKAKEIPKTCEVLHVVDSTYFAWSNDLRFFILLYAATEGLIKVEEIKDIIYF